MIKLSVLIPSYNHSKFILETLNSHVENNPFDYEIVIIDDGSTDNSVEIIQKWVDSHPEVKTNFVHRENRGITATLNQLIDMAKGEFIRIFGSDDVSLPHANRLMIDYIEKNGIDACFGYCKVIDENGLMIAENSIENLGKRISDYEKDVVSAIISKWSIVGPSLMMRKSVFNVIGKFDEKSLIEDWYLYINLAAKCKIHFIKECIASYRHHQNNASRTSDQKKRIRNYESQIMSGESCMALFKNRYRLELKVAVMLLRLKKSIVSKNFFASCTQCIQLIYLKFLISVS